MFDNKQNFNNNNQMFQNNQNFNNDNNMFDNNQNLYNTQISNQVPYGNMNYQPMFSNQNAFNNSATNYGTENGNVSGNNFEERDLPPELGEIKNLSEATVSSAPTMDVLDSMNIMPNVLPTQNDPLSAYESGNFSFNNQVSNLNENPNIQETFNNQNEYVNIQTPVPNLNTNTQPQMSTQYDTGVSSLNSPLIYDTVNTPLHEKIPEQTDSIQQDDSLNNVKFENNYEFNPINIMETTPEININDSMQNDLETQKATEIDKEELESEELSQKSSDGTNVEILPNEDEGGEKQELNEDIVTMNNLGLDESYNEPDTLEIIDIDSEEEQDETSEQVNNSTNDVEEPSNKISDAVEKLKQIIEELKNQGINIQLEEFDFETMYQLIVKIDK